MKRSHSFQMYLITVIGMVVAYRLGGYVWSGKQSTVAEALNGLSSSSETPFTVVRERVARVAPRSHEHVNHENVVIASPDVVGSNAPDRSRVEYGSNVAEGSVGIVHLVLRCTSDAATENFISTTLKKVFNTRIGHRLRVEFVVLDLGTKQRVEGMIQEHLAAASNGGVGGEHPCVVHVVSEDPSDRSWNTEMRSSLCTGRGSVGHPSTTRRKGSDEVDGVWIFTLDTTLVSVRGIISYLRETWNSNEAVLIFGPLLGPEEKKYHEDRSSACLALTQHAVDLFCDHDVAQMLTTVCSRDSIFSECFPKALHIASIAHAGMVSSTLGGKSLPHYGVSNILAVAATTSLQQWKYYDFFFNAFQT